jgi:hypothetical protein
MGSVHAFVSLHAEWSVEISTDGDVRHAADGGQCQLSEEQRAELSRALSALPSSERKDVFGGPVPTDVYSSREAEATGWAVAASAASGAVSSISSFDSLVIRRFLKARHPRTWPR